MPRGKQSFQFMIPVLLVLCLCISACSQHSGTPRIESQHKTSQTAGDFAGVFYQIYVRAFYDSDGDGIGDLNGVIQKMDYLEDLGIGGIWLMPLFRAPTNHKYFSSNYMLVDPEYGSNGDLRQLVLEAHRRGMKVIIDFMVNHTSNKHPWFHASTLAFAEQNSKHPSDHVSKYLDYYHWAPNGDKRVKISETHTRAGVFDDSRLKYWREARSITGEPVGLYYSRFVDAPDLNYDNPAVREEIKNVAKYWLTEIGIDGLRLYAARHIYDCENAKVIEKEDRSTIWWSEFCREIKTARPDCLLIGEIWSNPRVMAAYLQTGMHSVYDFQLAQAIRSSVLNERDKGIVDVVQQMNRLCRVHVEDYVNSTFVSTHDFPRLMTIMKNDDRKVRLVVSLLLTLSGRPFIYYGDELGLRVDKWLTWLSMPWDEKDKDPGQTAWMSTPSRFTKGIRPVTAQKVEK